MISHSLIRKLEELPDAPGVYLFKNAAGEIIYIGKALSLRNRVRQYFQSHRPEEKVSFLVQEVEDLELVVVDSEKEAWLLESSLIHKYQPKYNTNLKDDKQYPFLRLTNEPFPRLSLVRRVEPDGSRYFGPYIPSQAARMTLNLAQKLFRICWCKEKPGSRSRPCLDYYIKRCLGVCALLTSQEIYAEAVRRCTLLLEGKQDDLLRSLHEQMTKAAADERFEEAVKIRDIISNLEAARERQKMIKPQLLDQDVFGCYREAGTALILVFNRRRGIVVDRREFITAAPDEVSSEEFLSEIVLQYFDNVPIPPKILVPFALPDSIEEILSEKAGRKVHVVNPSRGEGKHLVDLLSRNARQRFETRRASEPLQEKLLVAVQQALSLQAPPTRIEGFDISHLGGTGTVASLVVFEKGFAEKREYRRYHVKTVKGVDDFRSIREVVFRRYKRVLQENLKRPDLILIDGGKGQLSAAEDALQEVGLSGIPLAAIAKREEEIFVKGLADVVRLPADSPVRQLLQRVRDEAHRFAVAFQRKTREAGLRKKRPH